MIGQSQEIVTTKRFKSKLKFGVAPERMHGNDIMYIC